MAIQHRRLGETGVDAKEAVGVVGQQGVGPLVRRFAARAAVIDARLVVLGGEAVQHPLPVANAVVHGEDVALDVGETARADVAVVAPVEGEVRLPAVGQLHVVDAAAGTGQEDHVRVEPVDVEVVPVKALARPEHRVLERTAEARQIADFGKHLAGIEAGIAGGPVVAGLHPVRQHQLVAGPAAIVEGLGLQQVGLHVGVILVAKATHGAAHRAGRGDVGAAAATIAVAVHQQARAGIAVELEALGPGGLLVHLLALGLGHHGRLAGFVCLALGLIGPRFGSGGARLGCLHPRLQRRQTSLDTTIRRPQRAAHSQSQRHGQRQLALEHRHRPHLSSVARPGSVVVDEQRIAKPL